MEKLFLLMPDLTGTRIDLDSQSNKKLTNAEIVAPVGIEKADLPGLVDDLAQLDAGIKEEAERAIAADKAHDEAIAQEITDRIAGDAAEAAARAADIKAEAGAREAADIALGLRIDDVISNVDPAALDSLTEVVAAFQSADSDLNKAITDVLGTHTSELAALSGSLVADIAAETGAREAADKAITAAFEAGDKAISEKLAEEAKTREGAIAAEAKTREDADAEIIAAVGYNDRGDLAAKLFAEYSAITEAAFATNGDTEFYPINEANFAAWLSRQDEVARQNLEGYLSGEIKGLAEETNNSDVEIIAAVGYNDRGDASATMYNDYAAQTEVEFANGNTEFYPINEANFQAWLDRKAEEARQDLDANLSGMIKALAEESNKADVAEAEARANADADLNARIDKEIKAEVGAREAADIALGLRIDDVISNTDPAALDSLSEIVAAFQSADSDLNKAITDVLGTHTSELAALSGSLVADIAAADVAVTEAFKEGDKALAEQLASEVITLDTAISALSGSTAAADTAINDSIAKLSAGTNDQIAVLDQRINEERERAIAAEGELDNKVSDIISNTDLTALDSFSEVEAGVNAGFANLKAIILEVAQNSIERSFDTVVADGTQVLFAGYPTQTPKVFVNGILQEEDVDYTSAGTVDGKGNPASDITFVVAPVAGARVIVKGVESAHNAEDRYETPVVFTPTGA